MKISGHSSKNTLKDFQWSTKPRYFKWLIRTRTGNKLQSCWTFFLRGQSSFNRNHPILPYSEYGKKLIAHFLAFPSVFYTSQVPMRTQKRWVYFKRCIRIDIKMIHTLIFSECFRGVFFFLLFWTHCSRGLGIGMDGRVKFTPCHYCSPTVSRLRDYSVIT